MRQHHVMSGFEDFEAAAEAIGEFHTGFQPKSLIIAAGQIVLRAGESAQIEATPIEVDGQRLWCEKALKVPGPRIVQVMEEQVSAHPGSQVDASFR